MEKTEMTPQDVIQRVAVPGGMTALSIEILSRSIPQAWAAIFQEIAEKEKQSRRNLVL
jgi:pyrroline-5-carboxylate reductase